MELDSVYARNDRVVSRKIVDELILVPIRQSVAEMETLYTLNEVGARVYELIDGKRPVGEIVEAIVTEFEVAHETAEADVREFITQLLQIEGIREIPS
ncbi:MAG TPA: PqqD family protein [Vicinamibacteria bacterium]|nr:PqqD family protein [Vicinamibacteria bacterium]